VIELSIHSRSLPQARVAPGACLDLSLAGVQLYVPERVDVGAAISCMLLEGHEELRLSGRVCWSMADVRYGDATASRVGIFFDPLSAAQLQGYEQTLLGVAVPNERGVYLHVPLPSLESGSLVMFQPLADPRTREGVVINSQLSTAPGTRAVELTVLLEPAARTHVERAWSEPCQPLSDEPLDSRSPTVLLPAARARKSKGKGKTRPRSWSTPAALLICALCWLAGQYDGPIDLRAVFSSRAKHERARAQTASAADIGLPVVAAPSKQTEDFAPALALVALLPEDADTAAAATLPAGRDEPELAPRWESRGDTCELFIPLVGTLARSRVAIWSDPLALAVEIPEGQIPLERRRYEVGEGGVAAISFGRPGGTTHLRVFLEGPPRRYAVDAADGGILVRVTRGAR
jgi:hypothetical protein